MICNTLLTQVCVKKGTKTEDHRIHPYINRCWAYRKYFFLFFFPDRSLKHPLNYISIPFSLYIFISKHFCWYRLVLFCIVLFCVFGEIKSTANNHTTHSHILFIYKWYVSHIEWTLAEKKGMRKCSNANEIPVDIQTVISWNLKRKRVYGIYFIGFNIIKWSAVNGKKG